MKSCMQKLIITTTKTTKTDNNRNYYCNSLLFGAPASMVDKLQCSQNVLARVVFQAKCHASAKHWLRVRERISYKMALFTYKAHNMSLPDYLARLLQCHVPTRSLQSSVAPLLLVPRTQTNIGKRAFSVAALLTWNALPNYGCQSDSLASSNQDWKPHCSQLPLTLRT